MAEHLPPSVDLPESGASKRSSSKKHPTISVYQTIVAKEIRTPPPSKDCDMELVASVIQRCILPEGVQELQFAYRLNDTVVALEKRKRRTAAALDDASVLADCATYSTKVCLLS